MVPSEKKEKISLHGVLGQHQISSKERIEVLPNEIACHHFSRRVAILLCPEGFPKAFVMEILEMITKKVYLSLRFPPNISFTDHWTKELSSDIAG